MIEEKELMVKLLSVLFPKAKVYLFGSRARGTHSTGSDIDLAIDNNEEISVFDVAMARRVLEALDIPQKIDVVDFNSVSPELQEEILKVGILWKE